MSVVDPSVHDLTASSHPSLVDALLPIVAPIIQQGVQDATASLHARVSVLEGQVATTTPVAPSTDMLQAAVAPLVHSALADAQSAIDSTHQESLTLISNVAADVEMNRVAIEQQIASAGGAVITNITTDVQTQRFIAGAVVIAVLAYGLAIIIGCLAGNSWALKIWVSAPGAVGALVLLFARLEGLALPTTTRVAAPTTKP